MKRDDDFKKGKFLDKPYKAIGIFDGKEVEGEVIYIRKAEYGLPEVLKDKEDKKDKES